MDSTLGANPSKVVPLLQALGKIEDLTSALASRLDPIVQHDPANSDPKQTSATVTGRINSVGDVLQYLLDHIEL